MDVLSEPILCSSTTVTMEFEPDRNTDLTICFVINNQCWNLKEREGWSSVWDRSRSTRPWDRADMGVERGYM